jgi:hypothetical protein
MTTRNPNPTGELVLVDYFYETASTHYDKSRKVTLSPTPDGLIVLEESEDECDQFKGPRTERTERWKIEREKLISLIKEHGEST